jgi:dCMP deaminase
MDINKIKHLMILSKYYANIFSDDPDTTVGAIFIDKNYRILSIGCNHSPYIMKLNITSDQNKNKYIKPSKYNWIEHAERNAIFNALNNGISLNNSICITTLVPCIDCTKAIISSGVSKVYTFKPNINDNTWLSQFNNTSKLLLDRANILYEFIDITLNDIKNNISIKGWEPSKLYNSKGGKQNLKYYVNKTLKIKNRYIR